MSALQSNRYREVSRPESDRRWVWSVVFFLQIVSLMPLSARAEAGPPPDRFIRAKVLLQHGIVQYQRGHYDAAVAALEEVRRLSPGAPRLRYYLARAYRRQGDSLRNQGQTEGQYKRYRRALDTDPRLLEDVSFVNTYRALQVKQTRVTKVPRSELPFKLRHFHFGLGLTLGVEGLLGVQVGLLFFGVVNPLLTFSPVLRSLDFTLRFVLLRQFSWSPYISAGVALPIPLDRSNNPLHIEAPTVHGAVGVHYISDLGLSFAAGISFAYNFAPNIDAPFLPMPSVQFSWYF